MYDYWPCSVVEVHDADTVKFRLDLGVDTERLIWVRLNGVWSPELDEPDGTRCRDRVAAYVWDKKWRVRTFKVGKTDKERMSFIRYIADVTDLEGVMSLNRWVIDYGYGKSTK